MERPQKIQPQKVIGIACDRKKMIISEKDAIIYALGIGFSQDPMREEDYKYTNQLHEQFTVFPLIGCGVFNTVKVLLQHPNMPEFSPLVVLHAEQRLVMVSDTIEAGMEYATDTKILDVVDKGKNALVYFRLNTYQVVNGKEVLVFYHDQTIFLRGYGGFGFPGQGLPTYIPTIPESAPDITLQASTYPSQAFVFGLTNDLNPIHVDPKASAIQHFPKPILNGLATYGTVGRVITQELLNNTPGKIKQFACRFIGYVFPGESLIISLWKTENGFIFTVIVVQRKTKVLIGELKYKPTPKI